VNTAVKKDFYTILDSAGRKSDAVESMLANAVEAPMKNIIGRLDERNLKWKDDDHETLALFVSLLRTRTPAFDRDQNQFAEQFDRWWAKATHSSAEVCEESIRRCEQQTGEDLSHVSAQDLFEMIRDDQYELKNPRQNNIKLMVSVSLEIARAIFRLNWEILSAPKGTSFVTCDDPFTVVPPPFFDSSLQGYGILTPGASTIVPLSGKTAVCFFGGGDRFRGAVVRRDFLRNVNLVVAANSDRFVIARDEALLRSVVLKGKLDQWRTGPRLQMNAPDPYDTGSSRSNDEDH
jgi:hypothetical protein